MQFASGIAGPVHSSYSKTHLKPQVSVVTQSHSNVDEEVAPNVEGHLPCSMTTFSTAAFTSGYARASAS